MLGSKVEATRPTSHVSRRLPAGPLLVGLRVGAAGLVVLFLCGFGGSAAWLAAVPGAILAGIHVVALRQRGRVESGAARQQIQSRSERLSQHFSDIVLIVDGATTIQYVSPACLRVLGWLPPAVIGKKLAQVVGTDDREAVDAIVASVVGGSAGRATPATEVRTRRPDGQRRVLELVASPAVGDAGEPVVVVNARDVSERHAAMEALRQREARDHALFDALPDAIVRFDRTGRFEGYVAGEMAGSVLAAGGVGRSLADLYPPEIADPFLAAVERAHGESRLAAVSYREQRPDGIHELEARIAPISGDDDVLAVIRDVTDARESAARTERLALILDQSPDYVWSATPDGQLIYTNAAFRELLAILPDEDRADPGGTFGAWQDAAHQPLWGTAVREAVRIGAWRGDVTAAVVDGREIPVSLVLISERRPDGSVTSITGIGRNISERRRNEREITRAKEDAEEANRAKSEFLATMSHEIRTPMNGIIGAADLLLDSPLTSEQRDYGQTLRDSGEALLAIINDILDLSKIEARHIEIEAIEYEVQALVDAICGVQAVAAHRRGLELLYSIDEQVPGRLVGDPARLRQILMNLLGNAIKFTARGEVVLRVTREGSDEGGRAVVRFAVSDTGIGISAEARERLFKPFSQADATMSRRFGGTGLGLAISRELVELMAGRIGVDSVPGEGSTFWFVVPFPVASADGDVVDDGLQGRTVLVINPSSTSRAIVADRLAGWGVNVIAVPSATQACAQVYAAGAAERVVAAILDDPVTAEGSLDDTGAVAEARRLVCERTGRRVPIFVVSAIEHRLGADEMAAAGIVACLRKPLRPSDLYDALVTTLGSDGLREPGPGAVKPSRIPGVQTIAAGIADTAGIATAEALAAARILLVEDNPVNQKIAMAMLRRLGCRADLAETGLEAVELAGATAYDLILMDLQLPGLDGLDATTRIRRAEAGGAHAVVVALTANATPEDRANCLDAGMDDYLSKPVRADALRDVLDRWIVARSSSAEEDGAGEPATGESTGSPAEPDAEIDLLDPAAIAEVRALDDRDPDSMLSALVIVFVAEAARRLADIAEAITRNEWADVAHTAHVLAESAATIGARRVAVLSTGLRSTATMADHHDARALVSRLGRAVEMTRDAFEVEVGPSPRAQLPIAI
jgi:PAS domain S-box-containing protein